MLRKTGNRRPAGISLSEKEGFPEGHWFPLWMGPPPGTLCSLTGPRGRAHSCITAWTCVCFHINTQGWNRNRDMPELSLPSQAPSYIVTRLLREEREASERAVGRHGEEPGSRRLCAPGHRGSLPSWAERGGGVGGGGEGGRAGGHDTGPLPPNVLRGPAGSRKAAGAGVRTRG